MLMHSQEYPTYHHHPKIMKMNCELYYGLITYLGQRKMPSNIGTFQQTVIKRTWTQFETDGATLRRKGRLVIPEHSMQSVIKEIHDEGHLGATNTYDKALRTVWWPKMEEDIRTFVRTCDKCQKYRKDKKMELIGSAKIVMTPFYHIGMDVIGPLPLTLLGNRYIIVAVDFFSKWVEAQALPEANAQAIADFLHRDIIS